MFSPSGPEPLRGASNPCVMVPDGSRDAPVSGPPQSGAPAPHSGAGLAPIEAYGWVTAALPGGREGGADVTAENDPLQEEA